MNKYGIPVLADLPGVGQNLWDQPIFGIEYPISIPVQAQQITQREALHEYLQEAAGPYSALNGMIAFEKIPPPLRSNITSKALAALKGFPDDWPEVEYATASSLGPTGGPVGLIEVALAAPLSRGNVTIMSAAASDQPVVNMGWYTDPASADAQIAIAGLKRVRKAWSNISAIVTGPEIAPGPSVQTDADILTYIKNVTIPLYHAAGTCAMGQKKDPTAVVDSHARVFGVEGLRVVDNSIPPFASPGHPQSNVYMLAEKIADVILQGRSASSS
ncbi:MAG: hypothetical protein Q9163_003329 [Psora crenata]